MATFGIKNIKYGLSSSEVNTSGDEYWNLEIVRLIEHAIKNQEGILSKNGAFVVQTGEFTGRAANHKYIVYADDLKDQIWWNNENKQISNKVADALFEAVQQHFSNKDLFILDVIAGADQSTSLNVRAITETAWHSAFAYNMFRQPNLKEVSVIRPDFTIYHAPNLKIDHKKIGLNSPTCVVLDIPQKRVIITNTHYAGEIKKSIFSIMNYLLPLRDVMTMHCSANTDFNDSVAIFFGLSGTGKTTLSSDEGRLLIGDDEHGWSKKGVFNIEGGCYAKMINLSEKDEPQIYSMTKKFGTILENVVIDNSFRDLDFHDNSITENTRGSYSLSSLSGVHSTQVSGHPDCIIMLTADAFGVLPPISKLNKEQAIYHFLSGYTAKIAGTEAGITEPVAVFSACFGAPFMLLKPTYYADLLTRKIQKYDVKVYLVNTGWTGGPYGTGYRVPISETRAMIQAILDKSIEDEKWDLDQHWGLFTPNHCKGISESILSPIKSWKSQTEYKKYTEKLKDMFRKNFSQYEGMVSKEIHESGF